MSGPAQDNQDFRDAKRHANALREQAGLSECWTFPWEGTPTDLAKPDLDEPALKVDKSNWAEALQDARLQCEEHLETIEELTQIIGQLRQENTP